jgi:putative addiction module component (TIGR02574 family)
MPPCIDRSREDFYSHTMNTLPSQISALSVAEKFELLDALWQDIEAHPVVVGEEQLTELDRRMAKYEQDPSDVIPWEQIKADIFKQ